MVAIVTYLYFFFCVFFAAFLLFHIVTYESSLTGSIIHDLVFMAQVQLVRGVRKQILIYEFRRTTDFSVKTHKFYFAHKRIRLVSFLRRIYTTSILYRMSRQCFTLQSVTSSILYWRHIHIYFDFKYISAIHRFYSVLYRALGECSMFFVRMTIFNS